MSQIGKRRLGNIYTFFIFSTKLAFDDFQKTQKLAKYVREYVANLTRNSKIIFANVENNQ